MSTAKCSNSGPDDTYPTNIIHLVYTALHMCCGKREGLTPAFPPVHTLQQRSPNSVKKKSTAQFIPIQLMNLIQNSDFNPNPPQASILLFSYTVTRD